MQNYICSSCGRSFEADPDSKGMIVCSACGIELVEKETEHPLAEGTHIKGFEIIRHLASGGSGDVYLAEQITMKRQVALKILNSKHLSKSDIDQFFNEARNTARFENPHVISVLEFGTSDEGLYYLATRYVNGETIEQLLEKKHYFPEEKTLSVAIAVAESLSSIWDKSKMFHKDIKPANIMIAKDGEVVILDMGLAQEYGSSALINGEVEGSPYYMSPEQAHGETLSWSTDLYSLGATMYQMLAGVYPYDAPTVQEILELHDTAPFPEFATRAPGIKISEKTTAILRRMMGKQPSDRFTSWKEFIQIARETLAELQAETKQEVIESHNDDPRISIRKSYGTQRLLLFGILLLFLAAAAAAGIALYVAAHKNSKYAEKMLRPVRTNMKKKVWNVNSLEISLEKLEKHQTRFGVKPSLKKEIRKSRIRLEQYKKNIKSENAAILRFELETAESLKKAASSYEQAKILNDFSPRGKSLSSCKSILKMLELLKNKIRKYKFILPENTKRAQVLVERLSLMHTTIEVELKNARELQKQKSIKNAERKKKQYVKAAVSAVVKKQPVPIQKKSPPAKTVKTVPPKTLPVSAVKQNTTCKKPSGEEREIQIRHETLLLKIMLLPDKQKFGEISEPERQLASEKQDTWSRTLKQILDDARKLWNTVYDSRTRFIRYTFPEDSTGHKMMIGSIVRDKVYLYRSNMPNVIKRFSQFVPSEWKQFLFYAAQKTSLEKEYEAYCVLNGDFPEKEKIVNPLIRTMLPEIKRIWYGYLTGNQYPGIPSVKLKRLEIAERYAEDPDFKPFAHKIKIKYRNDETKKKGIYK